MPSEPVGTDTLLRFERKKVAAILLGAQALAIVVVREHTRRIHACNLCSVAYKHVSVFPADVPAWDAIFVARDHLNEVRVKVLGLRF